MAVTYIPASTYDPVKTDISLGEPQKFTHGRQYQILSDGKPMVLALNVKDDVPFCSGGQIIYSFRVDELSKTTLNSVRERLRKAFSLSEERMPQFITRDEDIVDGQMKDFFQVQHQSEYRDDPHYIVDRAGQPIKRDDLSWKEVSATLFIHMKGVRIFHSHVRVDYEVRQIIVTDGPKASLVISSLPGLEPEEDIEKLLAFV